MNIEDKNIVLKAIVGSQLYGTSTPSSDIDYSGIFIPDDDYLLGLLNVKEVDLSVLNKNDIGRNTSDAIDCKLYELKNYCNLALQNNPNILELLYIPDDKIVLSNEYYKMLKDNAVSFLSKSISDRFIGYALAQKKKMLLKPENYNAIKNSLEFLNTLSKTLPIIELKYQNIPEYIKFSETHMKIGDVSLMIHLKVGKVISILTDRVSRATHRAVMYDKYGYDTKFAMHTVRLLIEGITLMKEHYIEFPLKDANDLMNIRNGMFTVEQVNNIIEDYEKQYKVVEDNSTLPSKPNFHIVNDLVKKINRHFLLS